ncbi:MAG: porin family protein [Paludibacter sp.]|nr:porin family protein [Paludibacter sp.]MDD4198466.1 porin family protein [Paludibacter sp.]
MQHWEHLKRIAIIGLITVQILPFAEAQNNTFQNETYFGISAGPAASMVYFRPTVDQNFLFAYHGGVVFRYINEKSLGVQAEINYSQRGWSEPDESYIKRLDYLEVPFLTHVYFGNNTRFFFNVGPKVGYLLKETVLRNNNPASIREQHIQHIQNKFDYGLAFGLGCLFKIKKQVFQLEGRGNFSASDLFSNDRREYFDNSNLIHASVTLGWLMQGNK